MSFSSPSDASSPPTQPGPAVGSVAAVRWDGGAPVIIDQRQLPERLVYWRLSTVDTVTEAIRSLAVRGAPAIGITAAYGVALSLDPARVATVPAARQEARAAAERIRTARPTAVNLEAAIARVQAAVDQAPDDVTAIRQAALDEAFAIHAQDRAACAAIGGHGRTLLEGRRRILTHCNTGRLATGGDGTALGVIYALHAVGGLDEVLACETRPLLQGGRLTAWELGASGVPYRLIVDGAAGLSMQRGLVDTVIVGCDRVAANGDTANKIGTYGLAVLARRHGIPFYVAGPRSSFDPRTATGADIAIEERAGNEVRGFGGRTVAPTDAPVWNPAFDLTPAELIDGFITEVGIIRPPYPEGIAGALAAQGPWR